MAKLSNLDANQVIRASAKALDDGGVALSVQNISGNLVPEQYDQIELEYITSGPGTGEIGVVRYYKLSNLIATLTLTYDLSDRLVGVSRS